MLLFGVVTPATAKYFGVDTSAVEADWKGAPDASKAGLYASRLGATAERMDVSWKWVQPDATSTLRFGKYDTDYDAITANGMRPIILIHGSPFWARPNTNCKTKHCPPDNAHLDEWATFAGAVADHFENRDPLHPTLAIEVWNAPNTDGWWSVPGGPDPKAYAAVWSWAANAIHKADPGLTVITGGVGPNHFKDTSRDLSITTFLNGFYDTVNRKVLEAQDGLGLHSYPSKQDLEQPYLSARFTKVIQEARAVRDVRDPIGDQRQIWLTEIGATTTGPDAMSQPDQAKGLVLAMDRVEHMDDVAIGMIFTLIETKYSSTAPQEKGYGLLERGDNGALIPKLAYCWLAQWAGKPKPPAC